MLTRIASGGMAEVWLARSSSIGGFERLLAIKRMQPSLSHNAGFVSMFIDEAKMTVALNHPNIVHVYDFGRVDDDYFIAMEFVEGIDLATLAKRCRKLDRKLPVDMAVYILKAVFDGLSYAHTRRDWEGREAGVVHRDISPQNVLLSFDGQIKISDFGIAKATSKVERPNSGEIFGKLAYVSPEQCRGEPVDESTDMWSAGVILHELLCNERLFARDNDYKTMAAVEEAQISKPSEKNNDVPEDLDALVLALLERDRTQRLGSAREAAEKFALLLSKRFPTTNQYRLTDVIRELWDNKLPRLIQDESDPDFTKNNRGQTERTKPVGEHTAAEIVAIAQRQNGQVRNDSAWTHDLDLDATEQDLSMEYRASLLLEATIPSTPSALNNLDEDVRLNDINRLKRRFIADPNLWVLVDMGRLYDSMEQSGKALGALKLAAAKFAQMGLLIQAACIYRHMLDSVPLDEPLREELKRLRNVQGMPNADLLTEVFNPEDSKADFSEYMSLFSSGPEVVEIYTESPILSSLNAEQFVRLVPALNLRRYKAGEVIIKEGDLGDSFYMIGRGRVLVSGTTYSGERISMTALTDGDCFGEHGFFTGEPRNATVEALNDVMLLEADKTILNHIILEFPTVRESLRRFYKERIAQLLLAKSELFGSLDTKTRKALAQRFTFESYEKSDLIIREGDHSDAFYAIKSGVVQVYTGLDKAPIKLAQLGQGEIFGEIAAIEGSRRTASVRAAEDCELLRLEAAELNAMLAQNIELRRQIEQKIEDRSEAKLRKIIDSTDL